MSSACRLMLTVTSKWSEPARWQSEFHTQPHRLAPILLGHVMAHELGHALEGVDRYSLACSGPVL